MSSYADLQDQFFAVYKNKCRNHEFFLLQDKFYKSISVSELIKRNLNEQSEFVDYVTRHTVNACSKDQVKDYFMKQVVPTYHTIESTNVAGIANIAYMLAKIDDDTLNQQWLDILKQ